VKVAFTKPFKRDYKGLPENIQELIEKQIILLLDNPKHPSFRLKKRKGIDLSLRQKLPKAIA
jgi:mRNA-degrading endonuclease RelE of RelBE toxin-antitoxin system